jgi:hypothetical protein
MTSNSASSGRTADVASYATRDRTVPSGFVDRQEPVVNPSRRLLDILARAPRVVIVLVVLALLLGGAFLPGVYGAVPLLIIAALLSWLCRLAWRTTPPTGRFGRLLVVALLVAFAAVKLTG